MSNNISPSPSPVQQRSGVESLFEAPDVNFEIPPTYPDAGSVDDTARLAIRRLALEQALHRPFPNENTSVMRGFNANDEYGAEGKEEEREEDKELRSEEDKTEGKDGNNMESGDEENTNEDDIMEGDDEESEAREIRAPSVMSSCWSQKRPQNQKFAVRISLAAAREIQAPSVVSPCGSQKQPRKEKFSARISLLVAREIRAH